MRIHPKEASTRHMRHIMTCGAATFIFPMLPGKVLVRHAETIVNLEQEHTHMGISNEASFHNLSFHTTIVGAAKMRTR